MVTAKNNNKIKLIYRFFLLSLPIFIFCLRLLLTGNKVAPGDADYIIQTYEAMRRSILEFHQFPWWNPWVSGGVPLFANPQFGLFSIQTIFVLIFGSIYGTKLAILAYLLIGFWGFRTLFISSFKAAAVRSTLLAYIWTFGTFLTQRSSGHLTFFVIQFFPWALLLYLNRAKVNKSWLKLGTLLSLMSLTAAHNVTVMIYFVLAIIILLTTIKLDVSRANLYKITFSIKKTDVSFWIKTIPIFILFSSYRLFFTTQYLRDFPRSHEILSTEPSIGIPKAILAIFGPLIHYKNSPSVPQWSWLEASSYISIFSLFVVCLIIYAVLYKRAKTETVSKNFVFRWEIFLVAFCSFFVLALGDILGKYSLYEILRKLPIFSEMRVAVRWLAWCSITVIMFIASYKGPHFKRTINIMLAIAVIELFIYSMPQISKPYFLPINSFRPSTADFEQHTLFDVKRYGVPYDENLTGATQNNIGQVISGDALVDTRFKEPWGDSTLRCGVEENCSLVTNNGSISYWSPNRIVINRTGIGDIELDMNLGRGWKVNGLYLFTGYRTVEPNKKYLLTGNQKQYILEYKPRFSIKWAYDKIKKM